jgi:hypothetical protein
MNEVILEVGTVRPLSGRYSSVVNFNLPSKVDAGAEVSFTVTGHLNSSPSPTWPNFAVGFFYIEGPMSEITLMMDSETYTIRPGTGVAKYIEPLPVVCTSITLALKIKSLDAGSYKFCAVTGYVKEGTFYYDDRVDRIVESVAPPWPWWLLPLCIGIGIVAVVGGVIYYEERRREELMLMMMR